MWMLFARAPPPDAPYWPGRRWLAGLDAVAWPASWIVAVAHASPSTGLVGKVFVAVALMVAASRLRRALWCNHRYRFTTWRWARALGAFLLLGCMLSLIPNM